MNKNSERYRFILHENFDDKGVMDSKYYTIQKRKNILGFSYWKDIKSQKIIRGKFFEFKTTFMLLEDAQKFIDDVLSRDIPRDKTLKTIIYNKTKKSLKE